MYLQLKCMNPFLSGFTRVPNKNDQSLAVLDTGISTSSRKSLTVRLPVPRSEGDILSSPNLKSFTFVELKNATRNFRPDCLLGEGGFGDVYKGWINEQTLDAAKPGEGLIVAVKKLKREGFQGHTEWLVGFLCQQLLLLSWDNLIGPFVLACWFAV